MTHGDEHLGPVANSGPCWGIEEPRATSRGRSVAIQAVLENASVELIEDGVKLRKGKSQADRTLVAR